VTPVDTTGAGIGLGSVTAWNGHKDFKSNGLVIVYQIAGGEVVAMEYACS
jgi:hypothetical protein